MPFLKEHITDNLRPENVILRARKHTHTHARTRDFIYFLKINNPDRPLATISVPRADWQLRLKNGFVGEGHLIMQEMKSS